MLTEYLYQGTNLYKKIKLYLKKIYKKCIKKIYIKN